jgi:hypothetical protein
VGFRLIVELGGREAGIVDLDIMAKSKPPPHDPDQGRALDLAIVAGSSIVRP